MNKLTDALINLLNVKSIVTLVLTGVDVGVFVTDFDPYNHVGIVNVNLNIVAQ